jgi:hypothetical protein
MRSFEDLPGNPWPHDMQISVEECWQPLIYLLFVRSAWRLEIGSVPRLDAEPHPGSSQRPENLDVDAAVQRWLAEWQRAWTHFDPASVFVSTPDEATQHLLDTLTDDELWEATSSWPSDFWDSGIDQGACERWRELLAAPHGEFPEHRAVSALTEAWRAGLTTIIQLPYLGYFAHRINREHLVVSATTRRDPDLYRRAIEA